MAGRESHHGDGKPAGTDHPLEKGVRWIKKERAEHQGLGQQHNIAKESDRRITRASSDAGPELAGREAIAAMESPQALIAPLERGMGGLNKASSDAGRRTAKRWPCAPVRTEA